MTADLLVASIYAVVVAVVGGAVAWLGKGRFDALDRKIDRLEARLDGRFDTLQGRLDRRLDTLQSSMDAMRSDLTQVALAMGIRPRAQND